MLMPTHQMLQAARRKKYAVGAFNVYNMEGALAVVQAAEELNSPVMLQILPSGLAIGGPPLICLGLEAGKRARVPVSVHLDHCASEQEISTALNAGISSVMADGSGMRFEKNIWFTRQMVQLARSFHAGVEGELGKLSGKEDGMSAKTLTSKLTQPAQAVEFVAQTGVCALAVCIGNIHGTYHNEPDLDFDRLQHISRKVSIPLVLHGTSGLPDQLIHQAMAFGVCKFNVNTEVRYAYLDRMKYLFDEHENRHGSRLELVEIMRQGMDAMKQTIKEKLRLFGSMNQA